MKLPVEGCWFTGDVSEYDDEVGWNRTSSPRTANACQMSL